MTRKDFDFAEYQKYVGQIFLLLRMGISDWEREFLRSVDKRIGQLSEKQLVVLEKICQKYFKKD